jgi:Glutathione S-transferase, N-terminal domain
LCSRSSPPSLDFEVQIPNTGWRPQKISEAEMIFFKNDATSSLLLTMMTRPLAAVLFVIFSLISSCHGLANPIIQTAKEVQEFLSTMQGPGYNFQPSTSPMSKSAAALLNDLNIEASTEPALARVRAQQTPNLLTASLPAVFRLASGVFADGYQLQLVPRDDSKYAYIASDTKQTLETGVFKIPFEPIIMYEFEACPFCRKVREACSMLSLPVTFRPCPKDGPIFRPEIKKKYGDKVRFFHGQTWNVIKTKSSPSTNSFSKFNNQLFKRLHSPL